MLKLDGSNGPKIKDPEIFDFELEPDGSYVIDASFLLPQIAKQLNRFTVKLLHPNPGAGPGNENAGLILMKEAIFCPPSVPAK